MGKLHRVDLLGQVHPSLTDFAYEVAAKSPRDWQVVTGVRTQKQVDEKYAEGRTKPGQHAGEPNYPPLGVTTTNVATLAKAPHAIRLTPEGLYGCAVDLMFFGEDGKLSPGQTRLDRALYRWMGDLAADAGFKWGGTFHTIFDQAHVELLDWDKYGLPVPPGGGFK